MTTKTKPAMKAKKQTKRSSTPHRKVSAETIKIRAQEIYHERINSGRPGDELSDWLEAESLLKRK